MNRKLKVGLIVDDGPLEFLNYNIIERSMSYDTYDIKVLLIQNLEKSNLNIFKRGLLYLQKKGLKKFFTRCLFQLIIEIEVYFLKFFGKKLLTRSKINLNEINIPKIDIYPNISPSGNIYRFNEENVDLIKSLKLDLLIRGGRGIYKGKILNVCKFGILSFHHGDNRFFRGSPAGFWEVFYKKDKTGFIIQRLTEELDGGDVLFRGAIRTKPLFSINQDAIFYKSTVFFTQLLNKIATNWKLPKSEEALPYLDTLYTNPNFMQLLLYSFNKIKFGSTKVLRYISRRGLRWSVAYQKIEMWKNVSLRKCQVIKNRPGRYFADPFPCSNRGKDVLFVEEYNFSSGLGKIVAIDITEKQPNILGEVKLEDCHLSFPFTFNLDNEIYMIPETRELGEVRMYRCVEFPLKWTLHKTLLKNVVAVDTMLLKHQNRWWLFTNLDSAKMDEHESELHIFFSDSFDSEKWTPHPNNPVVFDPGIGRNGGLLRGVDGKYFRVCQTQSIQTYGSGFKIASIDILNGNIYRENVILSKENNFFVDKAIASHTLSFNDKILAVDFALIQDLYN